MPDPLDTSAFTIEAASEETFALFGKVVTLWGAIDAFLTEVVVSELEFPAGTGHFIIGRMDSRAKLDKAIKISKWRKDTERTAVLKQYEKPFSALRDDRNVIAHWHFWGADADGKRLLFTDIGGTTINDEGELVTPTKVMQLSYLRDLATACVQMEIALKSISSSKSPAPQPPSWIGGAP